MAPAKKATAAPKKRSKAAKATAPAQANTETTTPAADAILEAPSPEAVTEDAATASVQTTPEEEAQRAGIASFTQLKTDADRFARSINNDGSLPMELPEAERQLQVLIDRAVEGKNIRVATEEDQDLVAVTEGDRPSSLFTANGVVYFAPGYAKETIRKLVGALEFISRKVARAAHNERINSVVSRLNNVSTAEELASAGTFLIREKFITEATPEVITQHRKEKQVHKLVPWNHRFYTAPFRVVAAFRDAKERVASTTPPAPVSSDRQDASSGSEWQTLRAEATLSPRDLFPESKAEGLCVFDAISRPPKQNNLGPMAIRRTTETMTLVKSDVFFLRESAGQTWRYGAEEIPFAVMDFIQRAAGSAPRPQSQPAPRPLTPRPATPAPEPTSQPSRDPRPANRRGRNSDDALDGAAHPRPRRYEESKDWRQQLREAREEFPDESSVPKPQHTPAPTSPTRRARAPKAKAAASIKPRAATRRKTAKAATATK